MHFLVNLHFIGYFFHSFIKKVKKNQLFFKAWRTYQKHCDHCSLKWRTFEWLYCDFVKAWSSEMLMPGYHLVTSSGALGWGPLLSPPFSYQLLTFGLTYQHWKLKDPRGYLYLLFSIYYPRFSSSVTCHLYVSNAPNYISNPHFSTKLQITIPRMTKHSSFLGHYQFVLVVVL